MDKKERKRKKLVKKVTKKQQKKTDSSSSSDGWSSEEDRRIEAMKMVIMREETLRFKEVSRKYKENKNIDMTAGRCCFSYENEKGARCI